MSRDRRGSRVKACRNPECVDVTHDPFAREALNAYADLCQRELPLLASDLREQVDKARWPDSSAVVSEQPE